MRTRYLPAPLALVLACLLLAPAIASAQQRQSTAELQLFELALRDGSRLYGTIESETQDEIVFRAHSGAIVTARRSEVVTLRAVSGRIRDGEFYRSDTQRTRLFFAPTARSLRKGQASFGMFQISAPFLQVGITDRFSFGGGTPLIFGFDESERPFWITPKLQIFDTGTRQAAVGALHLFNVDGMGVGIAYGVATFGTADDAVSVGAGLAYAEDSRGGVVMIGTEKRLRPNLKAISENYIWKNGNGILSGGFRFLGERLSADVGLALPIGGDFFFVFPVVNFVYVF